jgi:hypothetical protein
MCLAPMETFNECLDELLIGVLELRQEFKHASPPKSLTYRAPKFNAVKH